MPFLLLPKTDPERAQELKIKHKKERQTRTASSSYKSIQDLGNQNVIPSVVKFENQETFSNSTYCPSFEGRGAPINSNIER
jgi:hypothetical protein